MTTKEAVQKALTEISGYRLAKILRVSPIMVTRYKTGESCMSEFTAALFEANFGIEVTDARSPGRQPNENN